MDDAANPYRTAPGSEPPLLVGRDDELAAASYAIVQNAAGQPAQPIVFTGLRGVGKTALLRRCVANARTRGMLTLYGEAAREVPLSARFRQSLERAKRNVEGLPKRLLSAIDTVIDALPSATFEFPHETGSITLAKARRRAQPFAEALESLREAAHGHGRPLAIAVDEIQEGDAPTLLSIVSAVHEAAGPESSAPILFFGAGLPNAPTRLHDVRTYTERWGFFRLGLLTRTQTAEAIREPASARGVTIEPPALQLLVDESAGYPFFVQEYASAAWLAHAGYRITLRDVERIVVGVRKKLESSFYDLRFARLTPRECRYVLAMASLGAGVHGVASIAEELASDVRTVSSIRNQLLRKDVVFVPSPGTLEFRMPLTERYVAKHRSELEGRARLADDRDAKDRQS